MQGLVFRFATMLRGFSALNVRQQTMEFSQLGVDFWLGQLGCRSWMQHLSCFIAGQKLAEVTARHRSWRIDSSGLDLGDFELVACDGIIGFDRVAPAVGG
jgi:hypothetical protein